MKTAINISTSVFLFLSLVSTAQEFNAKKEAQKLVKEGWKEMHGFPNPIEHQVEKSWHYFNKTYLVEGIENRYNISTGLGVALDLESAQEKALAHAIAELLFKIGSVQIESISDVNGNSKHSSSTSHSFRIDIKDSITSVGRYFKYYQVGLSLHEIEKTFEVYRILENGDYEVMCKIALANRHPEGIFIEERITFNQNYYETIQLNYHCTIITVPNFLCPAK